MSDGTILSAFPRFELRAALVRTAAAAPFLADGARHYLKGRDALFWAYWSLTRGERTAWLPAYHCGVEVQAAIEAGFEPAFYEVGPDLELDLEDLERKLRHRPGPVLIIHYFGVAQARTEALARLCQQHGVPLIEDCAHALFSCARGRPLGQTAPLAIYSLPKTLGVLDGGLLELDPARLSVWTGRPPREPPAGKLALEPFGVWGKERLRQLAGSAVTRAYRRLRFGEDHGVEGAERSALTPGRDPGCAMSLLSRRVARAANPAAVRQARRARYSWLLERLANCRGFAPVTSALAQGVCPLVLPIWVADRARLVQALWARGVQTFTFGALAHPALPEPDFPGARQLRQGILGLPVHQQLSFRQLERLAALVAPLLPEHLQN